MSGPDKAKAALQGRSCHTAKLINQPHNTTAISPVNSCRITTFLAESDQSANWCKPGQFFEKKRHIQSATTKTTIRTVCHGLSICLSLFTYSYQPLDSELNKFLQVERNKSCSFFPHTGIEEEQDLKRNTAIIITNNAMIIFFIAYPFNSMPRDCSSFLITRLIQAASDSSPSCLCASSIKSRSSGSSRNWNGGLPRLSFLCVDTFSTPNVVCLCVITHYMHTNEKATPRGGGTLPRRLTKPLVEVIVMAGKQHTQTHPEFTWRFLALSVTENSIVHINAATERKAREQSPAGCVMVFAGRLPVQGG